MEQAAHKLGDVGGFVGIAAVGINAILLKMKADAASEQTLDVRVALLWRGDQQVRQIGERPLPVRNREQVAAVKCGIGKADERLVAAAVMPGQQG